MKFSKLTQRRLPGKTIQPVVSSPKSKDRQNEAVRLPSNTTIRPPFLLVSASEFEKYVRLGHLNSQSKKQHTHNPPFFKQKDLESTSKEDAEIKKSLSASSSAQNIPFRAGGTPML